MKRKTVVVAIMCAKEMKKLLSGPKETMFKPRTQEEQETLNQGIKDIDEAIAELNNYLILCQN